MLMDTNGNIKKILIKDLCSRLPYGVKCYIPEINIVRTLGVVQYNEENTLLDFLDETHTRYEHQLYLSEFKPYLFPLSSMTGEQKHELSEMEWSFDNSTVCNIIECFGTYRAYVDHSCCSELVDWLSKNHFDYRGLIPMGFAIDATDKNIY